MKNTKRILMKICLIFIFLSLISCQERKLISQFPIENYDQKISTWIKPNDPHYNDPLLTDEKQKAYLADFYDHVFGKLSPWNANHVKQILKEDWVAFVQYHLAAINQPNEGYGENYRKYDKSWRNSIMANINFSQLKNIKFNSKNYAIAIDNTQARVLPTDEVYFYDFEKAGQGFPFDAMQTSALWAGSPLYILTETKDRVWSLVATPDFVAWVKNKNIVRASKQFIKKWQQTTKMKMAVVTKHHVSILDKSKRLIFVGHLAMVFPITKIKNSTYEIIVPIANQHQEAAFKKVNIAQKDAAIMPLKATPHQFAELFREMANRPYGWGNLYFYNDCSAELKRLFAPFGIWLPRNSADQSEMENSVDISDFSAKEKLSYLMEHGKPLLTIVYIGGHVFLYVGTYQEKNKTIVMTYQNIWGLRPPDNKSRVVIGKSVFLPLSLTFPEDRTLVSQLNKKYFKVVTF